MNLRCHRDYFQTFSKSDNKYITTQIKIIRKCILFKFYLVIICRPKLSEITMRQPTVKSVELK